MKLDKESTVSLYIQLMHIIKEQIHNGTYLEGEQIPTEGELSKMYNISRITIRRTVSARIPEKDSGEGNICRSTQNL